MSVGVVNKQTGGRIPTAGMPAIDSVLSGSSTNPVQNRVVKAALDEKADTDLVASDFDATASYTAGNYCIYEGKFYKFKNNHSGAWSASDVDEIKIAGELSSIKSGLIDVISRIGNQSVTRIGYAAIDGNNAVSVELSDDFHNFDLIVCMNSYYPEGTAAYGNIMFPFVLGDFIFKQDAGAGVVDIDKKAYMVKIVDNTHILFTPHASDVPIGLYYVVNGVKLNMSATQ